MKEILDIVFKKTEKIIGRSIADGGIQDELRTKIDTKVKVDLYWDSLIFLSNIKNGLNNQFH